MSTLSLAIDAPATHSRLTSFFRYPLAIPVLIVNYVYAIVAYIAAVLAWFAIVITGRYPAALYDFVTGYLRFTMRAISYVTLAVDAYPPFSGDENPDYPVQIAIPARQDSYSRLKTFFRMIYIIPAYVAVVVLGILFYVAVILSWVTILVTARDPFIGYKRFALGWVLKFAGLFLLVIESY